MSSFAIRLLPEGEFDTTSVRHGRIWLLDTYESFEVTSFPECPVIEELPAYWRTQLADFVAGTSDCLLRVSAAELWVAYREGDHAVWQHQLLVPDWEGRLGPDGQVVSAPTRVQISDGHPVSEWRSTMADVAAFVRADE